MGRALVAAIAAFAMVGASLTIAADTTVDVPRSANPLSTSGEASPKVIVGETWGFEAEEGFVPGNVGGQAGWWTPGSEFPLEPHIDSVSPRTGTQHLRISKDPYLGSEDWTEARSPFVRDRVLDASAVAVWVAIGATGGAMYQVNVHDWVSEGVAAVTFAPSGDIFVHGSNTGYDWTPASYVQLVISIDPVTDTITYRYGGDVIRTYSGITSLMAIDQVVLISNNRQLGEHGDFDDLVIDRGTAVPTILHHWRFTADGTDSVGGAHAVLYGDAIISDGALDLAGGYAELPIGDTLRFLTDVTVETWVTWTGWESWERLFDFGTGTSVNWFMTPKASDTGRPRVAITTGGNPGEQRTDAPDALPVGTPTHVVFTLAGDSLSDQAKLYINGTLVATNSEPSALDPAELGLLTNIWLGRSQYDTADPWFRGEIDEFIIYEGALTAAEVLGRYLGQVFTDGFESGDTDSWSTALP